MAFFEGFSATLEIELTEPTQQIAPSLYNEKASPSAAIKSLVIRAVVYEDDDPRDLTPGELDQVVVDQPEMSLRGLGDVIHHHAPNGKHFTLGDVLAAITETERKTRHQSEWFGGIDVHHRFFEGIALEKDGVWRIYWGS